MQRRLPHQLSIGTHHTVVALDEATVAKIFTDDIHSDIDTESTAMRYANDINDLVVKWVRNDFDEQLDADVLVMERLYAYDYRAFELEKRTLWLEAFEFELRQLHESGWVHRKLYDAAGTATTFFDNILLTQQGLRLIGIGQALLLQDTGELLFEKTIRDEWEAVRLFKAYFLGR
jgi:hypothetical protein